MYILPRTVVCCREVRGILEILCVFHVPSDPVHKTKKRGREERSPNPGMFRLRFNVANVVLNH